jgi:hypothetical protein
MTEITYEEAVAAQKALVEEHYPGEAWTTAEFTEEFEALSFVAGSFCVCKRRSDGVEGTVEFTHSPRVYYRFVPSN